MRGWCVNLELLVTPALDFQRLGGLPSLQNFLMQKCSWMGSVITCLQLESLGVQKKTLLFLMKMLDFFYVMTQNWRIMRFFSTNMGKNKKFQKNRKYRTLDTQQFISGRSVRIANRENCSWNRKQENSEIHKLKLKKTIRLKFNTVHFLWITVDTKTVRPVSLHITFIAIGLHTVNNN